MASLLCISDTGLDAMQANIVVQLHQVVMAIKMEQDIYRTQMLSFGGSRNHRIVLLRRRREELEGKYNAISMEYIQRRMALHDYIDLLDPVSVVVVEYWISDLSLKYRERDPGRYESGMRFMLGKIAALILQGLSRGSPSSPQQEAA